MDRPLNLPDFRLPPLNEVVLGVQFSPARGYQQIRAGEVWALFKDQFPNVEELPPLPPSFETFGRPQEGQIGFDFVTGASHDRFWFLSPQKDELIQFQQDRLLHNWRKVGDQTNEYPRFEKMIVRFISEISAVERYFSSIEPQSLIINQAEITYINHIRFDNDSDSVQNWLSFINFDNKSPEAFSCAFRRIILSEDNKPQGRLICEAGSVVGPGGQRMIVLNLSARGAPPGTDIDAAIEFLKRGREMIVALFSEVTTRSAHQKWERVQ
jgi:uncharacterized protein (TIGR04255 family)